jgi:hypothetical protein
MSAFRFEGREQAPDSIAPYQIDSKRVCPLEGDPEQDDVLDDVAAALASFLALGVMGNILADIGPW